MTFDKLMETLPAFAEKASKLADRLGLLRAGLVADHIALRITERADAEALRDDLLSRGTLLSDKEINGRPILLIQLHTPMQVGPWAIDLVELPFPDGKKRRDGWEHVELVMPCGATDKVQMLEAVKQIPAMIAKWPVLKDGTLGIEIKTSCPKGDDEPLANPTVAFRHDGITVKVHPHDMRDVLGLRQAEATA
ncbi:VOC family protein [Ferrimonas balearica]|uniref:VOC family protein n=1 Tax=Ferrimonas balearica TaxID=44012 RepID=UPI001C566D6B|nr:VOC family protein [Ferrimonas balearica]MBW3138720.1 VOC family protein [Ferrimonas balearica]MBY6105781.1 VOC family protein [Ferrimonas balearica]MBY6223677.1 VOC family protein [Ferrimonas balearica]